MLDLLIGVAIGFAAGWLFWKDTVRFLQYDRDWWRRAFLSVRAPKGSAPDPGEHLPDQGQR